MRRNWGFLILIIATVLGGCEATPTGHRFPELTYAHLGMIRIDAARIEIADEYQEPLRPPNVDHLFPTPPERVMRRWATDRLAATGTPDRYARFVIQDAKVIETELPRTQGIRGAFTTDQTQRYDLTLSAAIEIREERGNYRSGYATASTSRSRTVAEDISVNEREQIWFELMEQAMNDLNAELERQIRGNLTRFVAP